MTNFVLYRAADAAAWELRSAWASGRRVAVSVEEGAGRIGRVEGHVGRVAPTGAFVVIAGSHVPLERVLAVHFPPAWGGDSTWSGRGSFRGEPRRVVAPVGQLTLWDGSPSR